MESETDDGAGKSALAYAALRAAIIAMQFPPGAPLSEKELGQRLGISRTPLREALLRLRGERLVVAQPGMGTYVNKIALPEVLQGKFIRQTLEMRVVGIAARGFSRGIDQEFSALMTRQREAAERHDVDLSFALDNEFHCLICRAAGLPKVWDVIQSATAQLDRMRRQAFLLDGFFMEVLTEHLELLTAIRALDAEEACRKMADHLDDIMESVRAIARDNPDMVEAGGIDLAAPPAF